MDGLIFKGQVSDRIHIFLCVSNFCEYLSGCDIAFLDIKMCGMSGIRSQISVIRKIRNSISINCGAVDCGYFDFLRRIPYAVNSYHGEYMAQYSWAEFTTATLLQPGDADN